MKGVVLAGGKGLRLYPLTKVTNKHLLPVGNEPMIFNPIRKLKDAGIKEVLVVTSAENMGDLVNLLGSGEEFDLNFTYKVQESASGIAHALNLAKDFANNEKIIVVLGDNITTGSLKPYVDNFLKQSTGARILLKKVNDPSRYGVASISAGQVTEIEEKPEKPKSDYAVIGYYMYNSDVFDIISNLKPSDRGEYEITDVNNEYIKKNGLGYDILDGAWTDAGTFESLFHANKILLKGSVIDGPFTDQAEVSDQQLGEMVLEAEKRLRELKKHQRNG
jgi:glucose-1-phosphate thymidylyltransferase